MVGRSAHTQVYKSLLKQLAGLVALNVHFIAGDLFPKPDPWAVFLGRSLRT